MVGGTGASAGFDAGGSADGDDSSDGDGDASGRGDGDSSGDGDDDSAGDAADPVNGVLGTEFTTGGVSVGILTADALGVSPAGCCNTAGFSEADSVARVLAAPVPSFRSNPSSDPLIF